MRILVTGGAGFIGKNLIFKLLSSPNNIVFNIDKLSYASHHKPIDDYLEGPPGAPVFKGLREKNAVSN